MIHWGRQRQKESQVKVVPVVAEKYYPILRRLSFRILQHRRRCESRTLKNRVQVRYKKGLYIKGKKLCSNDRIESLLTPNSAKTGSCKKRKRRCSDHKLTTSPTYRLIRRPFSFVVAPPPLDSKELAADPAAAPPPPPKLPNSELSP